MEAQEDSLLSPITGAADRSESTIILVAKVSYPLISRQSSLSSMIFALDLCETSTVLTMFNATFSSGKFRVCQWYGWQQTASELSDVSSSRR